MTIRKTTYEDLPQLMQLFTKARGIMRACGNINQWNDSYPSEEIIRKDIDRGASVVMCGDDGEIIATMAFIPGPDPTYKIIYDGEWPDNSPYYVIHRIATGIPGQNAAQKLFDWAFSMLGQLHTPEGGPECIRIDTHRDNVIMHHILTKYGFTRCGVIILENGAPRDAYIKKNL